MRRERYKSSCTRKLPLAAATAAPFDRYWTRLSRVRRLFVFCTRKIEVYCRRTPPQPSDERYVYGSDARARVIIPIIATWSILSRSHNTACWYRDGNVRVRHSCTAYKCKTFDHRLIGYTITDCNHFGMHYLTREKLTTPLPLYLPLKLPRYCICTIYYNSIEQQ